MKLKRLNLMVPVMLSLAVSVMSCTGRAGQKKLHSNVEYYRNVLFSETPYDIERGSHPVTAAEAKTVNAYKFTYDNSDRLVSVEYVRNDVPLGYGSLRGAAKITYTYDGNTQVKHFFDKDNKPVDADGVFTWKYSLDDKGIRTGLVFLGKNGEDVESRNKVHSWKWTVLPDGMVRELRYNLKGEETVMNPFCPFYELRFTYNDKGFVTRMANYKADTLYNCTAENCGDIGVSYFSFTPNDQGDVSSFSVFNVFGQMSNLYWGWSKRLTTLDENGYPLEVVVYDQDDEFVGGKLVPVTQNKYDEHGALVKSVSLNGDREIINDPQNGVAITEYKYDDKGQRTETLTFDKDHNPVKTKM
jgi:hypothetical protein